VVRPVVVVTSPLPSDPRPWLGDEIELVQAFSRPELESAVAQADGLICLLSDKIDAAFLDRAPRLKVVANFAVGIDNIDVPAATERGIRVTHTPDVLTEATADLAFAMMLASARRLREADAFVRDGKWQGAPFDPSLLLGADVFGQTLGIVGLGRIGRAVARRALGFQMPVLYAAPRRAHAEVERALEATHVPLRRLLAEADIVSLHCPLIPETRNLIGAAELAVMKPNAVLVNTARGACVDEAALAAALHGGKLAGVGLDVFADEPRVSPALLSAPRTTFAPHIGSATAAARERMVELCASAVRDVLQGVLPDNQVNHV
jgi:glyoxylate reductase